MPKRKTSKIRQQAQLCFNTEDGSDIFLEIVGLPRTNGVTAQYIVTALRTSDPTEE
jgi:hypothetical protein